jgi:hypothetical protein
MHFIEICRVGFHHQSIVFFCVVRTVSGPESTRHQLSFLEACTMIDVWFPKVYVDDSDVITY